MAGDMFIKLHSYFYKYPSVLTGSELKVLLVLSFQMSWDTNKIMLDPTMEDIVLSRLGMARDYFYKIVRRLVEKGLLKKDGWYYIIKPEFATKGRFSKEVL